MLHRAVLEPPTARQIDRPAFMLAPMSATAGRPPLLPCPTQRFTKAVSGGCFAFWNAVLSTEAQGTCH
jgi:hypothetical protein